MEERRVRLKHLTAFKIKSAADRPYRDTPDDDVWDKFSDLVSPDAGDYVFQRQHLEDDPVPHLIVCPASVLENWERDLRKWCPSFSVLQYHGSARSAYSKE
ncbi:hypothetical protein CASFOL_000718 [Castilleja foliolosa]|uniref:SNF2 N-terminal domain-containing protein n=1 Tax=Castilleja foliolosa TaxID=1961234 RepID=A0ABD3EKI3_9LAMI